MIQICHFNFKRWIHSLNYKKSHFLRVILEKNEKILKFIIIFFLQFNYGAKTIFSNSIILSIIF